MGRLFTSEYDACDVYIHIANFIYKGVVKMVRPNDKCPLVKVYIQHRKDMQLKQDEFTKRVDAIMLKQRSKGISKGRSKLNSTLLNSQSLSQGKSKKHSVIGRGPVDAIEKHVDCSRSS